MTHFAVVDPRTFDGNPYEVAERACQQAEAVARILQDCIASAHVMVRNAELERQIALVGEPDAVAFEKGAVARRLRTISATTDAAAEALRAVGASAGYDPKRPVRD